MKQKKKEEEKWDPSGGKCAEAPAARSAIAITPFLGTSLS